MGKDSKMDKNKIIVGIELDTAEVNKQVSELQRKIKGMREFGPTGAVSQLAQQYRAGGNEQRAKQLEEFRQRQDTQNRRILQQDLQRQDKLVADLLDKEKKINREIEQQKNNKEALIKLEKERASIQTELVASVKKEQILREEIGSIDKRNVRQALPFSSTHIGGNTPQSQGVSGLQMVKGIAGIIGLAGTALNYAGQLNKNVMTQEERQAGARSTIAGAVGEYTKLQQQGRGYEMDFYAEERAKAAEAATRRMRAEKTYDETTLLGRVGMGIGVGAAAGAGWGLLGGPLAPVSATAGAIGGGIIGGLGAFGTAMQDDRKRSMLFDENAYKQFIGAEGAKAYIASQENYKAQNFNKVAAQEYFENNKENIVRMQRALGLSDYDLMSGQTSLYGRGAKAGFNQQVIDSAALNILQSGGTTKAGIEGSVYAAQMERGLDLTNAPSLIGRISGRTGMGAAESKDEVLRLYSEAVRIGLDASEVRTLLETSTQMAMRSGVSSDEIQQVLQSGLAVQSQRGIEASQSAYERIKNKTGQIGGVRGQLAMAEFGSEEMTKLLGGKGVSYLENVMLTGTNYEKISADNRAVRGLLEERGIDPNSNEGQRVIQEMKRIALRSTIINKGREEAIEKLRIANEKRQQPLSPEEKTNAEKEYNIAYKNVVGYGIVEEGEGFGGQGLLEQESESNIYSAGLEKGKIVKKVDTGTYDTKMGEVGGRVYDQYMNKKSQEDFQEEIQRVTTELSNLREAFKVAAEGNEIKALLIQLDNLARKGQLSSDAMDAYSKVIKEKQTKIENAESQKIIDSLTPQFTGQYGATPTNEGN
jgi:hypothetical protein